MASKRKKSSTKKSDELDETLAVPDAEAEGVKAEAEGPGGEDESAESKPPAPTAPGDPVYVQSKWPGRLIVKDMPSGMVYIWDQAGDVHPVDPQDLDALRARNEQGRRVCCGTDGHAKLIIPN